VPEPLLPTLLAPLAELVSWLRAAGVQNTILTAHPEADIESVRRWVREFAAATSMSDLIDDFEQALARRRQR
jgi:hypothetical protein